MLAIALVLLATPVASQGFDDPDLGQIIIEGAADADFLWLRGSAGKLVRFDRATGLREVISENVVDLLVEGPAIWALNSSGPFSHALVNVRQASAVPRHLYGDGDAVGLFPTGREFPGVLTTAEVLGTGVPRWKRALPASVARYGHVTATRDGSIYIGYNRGEWGGGLRVIDPVAHSIRFVDDPGVAMCSGGLNPACEPVVGAFRDADDPDCVTVGTGLAHMGMSFGRVYRVCGDEIVEVYSTPLSDAAGAPGQGRSWALSDLTQTGDGWIGMSRDRYFRNRSGVVAERPVPRLRDWSGLRLSDEEDGVLFLISACCWGGERLELYNTIAVPVLR